MTKEREAYRICLVQIRKEGQMEEGRDRLHRLLWGGGVQIPIRISTRSEVVCIDIQGT